MLLPKVDVPSCSWCEILFSCCTLHSQASPAKSHQSPGLVLFSHQWPCRDARGLGWSFLPSHGVLQAQSVLEKAQREPQAQGMADPHISWGSPQLWELPWFPGTIPSVPSLILPPWNGIQLMNIIQFSQNTPKTKSLHTCLFPSC